MTLIARTRNHFAPTMIADLLITQSNAPNAILLPTIGYDITHLIPVGQPKPVRLAQKLYILNDNICMAFAGIVDEIRSLLEDFQPFCSSPAINGERLLQFVKEYDYSNFKKSAYFMMLIENNGIAVSVTEISYGDFSIGENELFDQTQAIGSGRRDFEMIINEGIKFTSSFKDGDIRQGIVKNGSLIARLLAEERYLLRSLPNQWGGGYELAYYDTRKIVKLDNTAYVIQSGNFVENGEVALILPLMVLYYNYQGENLIITTVEMHNLNKEQDDDFIVLKSNVINYKKYIVPSVKRGANLADDVGPVQSFETYSIGMGFVIDTPKKVYYNPSFYTYSTDLQVIFSAEEKNISIRMHKRVQKLINKMFKEAYPNYVKE